MNILAVDTSSKTCSVGLTLGRQVVDASFTSDRTHSRHLMGMVDDVLRLAGVALQDLDALAVTRGPGTFTGLRIGISTVKGLALACAKPLFGVSGLDALAVQSAMPRYLIFPMVDARRQEIYCAGYRISGGELERVTEEKAVAPEKVLETIDGPCVFVGDGARRYRELIEAAMGDAGIVMPAAQDIIRASTVARLAAERMKLGERGDDDRLLPLYIRQSDAQLMFGKRQATRAVVQQAEKAGQSS
jgi:tRNA threonylcarbamoyladenosine biosynthesis protein TsaB